MDYIKTYVECECGYLIENIYFGADKSIPSVYYYPALRETCSELIQVNTKDNLILCSKCKSNRIKYYGSPELLGDILEPDFESDDFALSCSVDEVLYPKWNIDDMKREYINAHVQRIARSPSLIYYHYNYCPSCRRFKLTLYPLENPNDQKLIFQ
jgi:hypothetical protein